MNSLNKEAGITRRHRKDSLILAYEHYVADRAKYEAEFYQEVQKFARMKLYHLEHDFAEMGSANTVDDWAQEVVIKVWQALDTFEGDSESFYAWVHKVCFNHASRCFSELKKQQQTKTPLVVEHQHRGEHYTYFGDNPALNPVSRGYEGSRRVDELLVNVEGTDKWICKLILDGNTQKQVAGLLHMTVKAVEHRIEGMRTRFTKEKESNVKS